MILPKSVVHPLAQFDGLATSLIDPQSTLPILLSAGLKFVNETFSGTALAQRRFGSIVLDRNRI